MIRSFNGKKPRIHPSAFISEAAYVVGDVEIEEGCSIWPGAVVRGDTGKVVIGKNTAIEDGCVVHSGIPGKGDTYIGEGCNIGHGAVVHCRKIGDNVMVGINATVLHDADIGNFCIIAAGCLVSQGTKVPDNSYVMGIPGRIKGPVPDKLKFWLERVPLEYVEFGKQYRDAGLGSIISDDN